MGAPVVWFEILGKDSEGLRNFYSKILGWEFQTAPNMDYSMISAPEGENAIGGGVGSMPEVDKLVTIYAQVKSIDDTLAEVEKNGGRTIVPRTVIPEMVTFAQFMDPQGNIVGIIEAM
ncbi:VOC family protein [bacterium]|nr:VOC family protein [bacterium]